MFRLILIIVAAAVVVAIGGYYLKINRTTEFNIGLVNDVAKVSIKHRRLPSNWDEFAVWIKQEKPDIKIDTNLLRRSWTLKWGTPLSEISETSQIFVAVDPRLESFEKPLNATVIRQCAAASSSLQNQ